MQGVDAISTFCIQGIILNLNWYMLHMIELVVIMLECVHPNDGCVIAYYLSSAICNDPMM
jgi:hypothetical protein